MSGLALTRAPPLGRPLRFLAASPLWGIAAGSLLALDGDALALGRWAPPAVALVHMFTLGVLGNAMLGSLLQFLPVAAATPVPGARASFLAHAALNLGLAVFVAGLYRSHALLVPASSLLAAALLAVALPPLPALLRRGAQRLLRTALGTALLALAATVALGVLAAAVLGGRAAWPLDRLVDAHAALGMGGWMLVLLAAVGSVTLPMFQGTAAVRPRALAAWLAATLALLAAAALARLHGAPSWVPALALAVPSIAFAAAVLWLQWHAPHRRNPALVRFWRAGVLALGLAAAAACAAGAGAPAPMAMLAGTLAIGIAVPLLVNGMLLEIVGFIAWIDLRGRCPRGVRIPAVGRLLPDGDKHAALLAHLGASALLAAAVAWTPLAPLAGAAMAAAYAVSGACLLRCLRRMRDFARDHGEPR
ncbi:hypothetical protein B1992_04000 [Pseudoxanthomonas broegbernensis]|uniref:Uncharacterized protein n=1 Tax=Pseudoxanthomonas broegbernensis TaxID=83619 RepID=A0A7V8K7Y4_9GAMM|nr:hypothetical protein [Pseudoxanthomonas broegbernensis]KAF1687160.1 hypothetical protein B1992_04000 [Pseudoxanthomonas broegbernensis]MBB6065862.1 hypothetical protein [Pseudoxanthomonas broegbernensis]